jgi:hypothetical protein
MKTSVLENIELIKTSFIVIAAILAYFQYWSANKFKRSQYLSELWRKFYTTEKLTFIFQALERKDKAAFKNISESDIYLFLGYMEEVVIFVKTNPLQIHKIDEAEVLNLFQFHFFYIYQLEETKKMFWGKILDKSEDIDSEINQFYWKKQLDFSKACKKRITKYSSTFV